MIKSFLKKVFSASSDHRETEEERLLTEAGESNSELQEEHEMAEADLSWNETVTITKEWLDKQSLDELDQAMERLYGGAMEDRDVPLKRLRIRLEDALHAPPDSFLGKKLGNFLDLCEQQMIDFPFFLDKKDAVTMEIYRTYALPKHSKDLDSFLRERCMMISETSEELGKDYRSEMEEYLQALQILPDSQFFADFEQWRAKVLKKHEEEIAAAPVRHEETVMLRISKEEVENENIQQIEQYMREALQSPETAKSSKGSLLFSFYGYNHANLLDLMNKKEINDWASLLVEKQPYVFYFLNDDEYPMTRFLTSLVVTTEVEDDAVYYNEEELMDFKQYIQEALVKLADWLGEDAQEILREFDSQFSHDQDID